jgi:hypothetical protein
MFLNRMILLIISSYQIKQFLSYQIPGRKVTTHLEDMNYNWWANHPNFLMDKLDYHNHLHHYYQLPKYNLLSKPSHAIMHGSRRGYDYYPRVGWSYQEDMLQKMSRQNNNNSLDRSYIGFDLGDHNNHQLLFR